jgi:hypothetical protein
MRRDPTGFGLAPAVDRGRSAVRGVGTIEDDRPSGDRVKTDRRDAERIARLARSVSRRWW